MLVSRSDKLGILCLLSEVIIQLTETNVKKLWLFLSVLAQEMLIPSVICNMKGKLLKLAETCWFIPLLFGAYS